MYIKNANGMWTYLVLYVEDIVLASSTLEEIRRIERKIKSEFEMDHMQELKNFLGMRIQYNMEKGTLRLNQGMDNCKPVMTSLLDANPKLTTKDDEEATQHPYRELIGCLTNLMFSTRPYISIAVNFLSRFQSGVTDEPRDQKRMKHLDIRYNFIRECIQSDVIKLQYIPGI